MVIAASMPAVNANDCVGCGICVESCRIDAIIMSDAGGGKRVAEIGSKCLGCGICATRCPCGALTMVSRPEKYIPPVDSIDLFTRIAREKNRMYFKLGPVLKLGAGNQARYEGPSSYPTV